MIPSQCRLSIKHALDRAASQLRIQVHEFYVSRVSVYCLLKWSSLLLLDCMCITLAYELTHSHCYILLRFSMIASSLNVPNDHYHHLSSAFSFLFLCLLGSPASGVSTTSWSSKNVIAYNFLYGGFFTWNLAASNGGRMYLDNTLVWSSWATPASSAVYTCKSLGGHLCLLDCILSSLLIPFSQQPHWRRASISWIWSSTVLALAPMWRKLWKWKHGGELSESLNFFYPAFRIQISTSPCSPTSCLNGATCLGTSATAYTCSCAPGFWGADCSQTCQCSPAGPQLQFSSISCIQSSKFVLSLSFSLA